MALDPSIFRKSAIERLQNPERLDHLMQVTTPRGWVVLAALAAVTGAGVLWGFMGSVPTEVEVLGIMLREGGIYEVQSRGSGQVERLLTGTGRSVEQGEVVAYVAQPQIDLEIQNLEEQLARIRTHRDEVASRLDVTTRIEIDALARQREQATAAAATAQARIAYLEQREQAEGQALERGLITPDIFQGTVSTLAATRDQLVSAEVTLRQLEGRAVTTRSSASDQVYTLDQEISALDGQIADARERLLLASEVVSPFTGTVLEELVDVGENVSPGRAVFALELAALPLNVFLFTPEGTRVEPGMSVQMVPAGVTPEENGYMLGRVDEISPTPLGTQAMNRYLRNDALVQSFLGAGGAYLIYVTPDVDSSTVSGFRWTTRAGPDLQLGSGTLLSGNVLVDVQRPVTLVIPALRRWLAGDG